MNNAIKFNISIICTNSIKGFCRGKKKGLKKVYECGYIVVLRAEIFLLNDCGNMKNCDFRILSCSLEKSALSFNSKRFAIFRFNFLYWLFLDLLLLRQVRLGLFLPLLLYQILF